MGDEAKGPDLDKPIPVPLTPIQITTILRSFKLITARGDEAMELIVETKRTLGEALERAGLPKAGIAHAGRQQGKAP